MNGFEQLVAQSDGVTVALEDHPVKSVADDEPWQGSGGGLLHARRQVGGYGSARVYAHCTVLGRPCMGEARYLA